MISKLFEQALLALEFVRNDVSDGSLILASSLGLFFLSLLIWRAWIFSVHPWLHPEIPIYLPYWIPLLGHAIPFFQDVNGLVGQARRYLQGSREPLILYVAGEQLVVLTSPDDLSEVYKNTSTLTFDGLIRSLHKGVVSVTTDGFETLWRTPAEGYEALHPNPGNKVLVHYGNDILRNHLLPGQRLESLTLRFLAYIEKTMQWDNFFQPSILASSKLEKIVSLKSWSLEVLVDAATKTIFGEILVELEPSMSQTFSTWDDNSYMVTYRYPSFLAKAAIRPRNKLIKALLKYLETPKEERKCEVEFVRELEDEQRHAGLSNLDSARVFFLIFWVINANAHKAAFWIMAHPLSNTSLLNSIRAESFSAIAPTTSSPESSSSPVTIDHKYLLNSCPHLNSLFNEVLRVTSNSANIREVLAPTLIGSKVIPTGMKLFIPHRQLLLDEEGFGSTAQHLDPDRFFHNKELERSGFYRPFGGGTTLCSGRFIAIALWRFEVEKVDVGQQAQGIGGKPFPHLDNGKPSLGIAAPLQSDDVIVKVRERNSLQENRAE